MIQFMKGCDYVLNMQMAIKRSTLLVRLKGELDQGVAEELKKKVSDVIEKYYVKNLIINLNEVPFMDSTGIGFIIGRYAQLKTRKGKVVVCAMNEMVERIFNLSGLKRICLVAADETEAQKYVEVPA